MPDSLTRREAERKRLLALVRKRPATDTLHGTGVLLSDAIQHYVTEFDLISRPFDDKNLKPANYKLTIGDEYAIGGTISPLSDLPGQNEIRIKPFEVAVIKTSETLNLPPFLIARWNIQVSRAYQGLLWVGGPQVDAGYVGHLFCPIYNLSDEEVLLHQGEPIAVIDFVKTTAFHKDSKAYLKDGALPDRILFEDYLPQKLKSALATKAEQEIGKFKTRLETMQTRMDLFVTITFAIIALLFAALTLFVGKPGQSWWDPTVFWISAIALALSMLAWVRSGSPGTWFAQPRWNQFFNWILAIALASVAWAMIHRNQAEIQDLKDQIQKLQKLNPPAPSQPKPKGSQEGSSTPIWNDLGLGGMSRVRHRRNCSVTIAAREKFGNRKENAIRDVF
jgi:deoxycytidine triphosphate deaminase